MYLQPAFVEADRELLYTLIRKHPLATLVTLAHGEVAVNHLPMHLCCNAEPCLQAHVPRASEVWRHVQDHDVTAVFHGPQSYVTPSWYPGKAAHGRVVPTWNYAVVHVRGRARAIHEADWLMAHLQRLTNQQEAKQAQPWQVGDAPADFTRRLVEGLVGIELPVTHLTGKWKVSQNRSVEDQRGVLDGLGAAGPQAQPMHQLMQTYIPDTD
ncbi:MAG: FMN-binding negative transcriptional regulator [Pseudomonadota bacterium]